jgi:hypothetical protein
MIQQMKQMIQKSKKIYSEKPLDWGFFAQGRRKNTPPRREPPRPLCGHPS